MQRYDRAALANALGAHVVWGSMPLYLLLVKSVPALEYVAWRILFTLPVCLVFVLWRKAGPEVREVLRDRRALLTLLASSALIGFNWFLYVWAIQTDHVYAASLGYYILPLTMMLLGLVVLGERLGRLQWAAVALAGAGVAALAAGALTTLWLSLAMALSFGMYGLLRKTVNAGPLAGLTLETLMLAPVAAAIAWWFAASPEGSALGQDPLLTAAVAWGGPMTAVPLLMFAFAARRLPYSVVGFLQFSSPTIVFLIGLLVFGEELSTAQLACFVAIWMAALLFIWDMIRGARAIEAPVTPVG
ncbi:EamA family transporter RarD [Altererythrobacter soli]|uniref:EamA family transporter RarD n=1 Tax=Croceibacterium soli TaxID=1739690 RepID=A0A6I4UXI0_9SPHN|nr:EamA family transporter RarD [Croceibacterium soli]MXP42654.1 EamA family transporter RarD [Croceibacterium soli]